MYYNRNDRKVLLYMLCGAVVCCIAFFALERFDTSNVASALQTDSISTTDLQSKGNNTTRRSASERIANDLCDLQNLDNIQMGGVRLFFFDPNTASAQELLMLGLKSWQVRNLLKYRTRGGVFRKPEDIGKLYGLSAKQYKTLLPYVRIDREQFMPASMIAEKDPYEPVYTSKDTFLRQHKIGVGETVNISIADTSALKTVPGIGSYFARKIVYYRNELGGYVSVGQLDEINDFPQEAKKFLVVKNAAVKKININKASLVQMKRHPYMGFFRAKTIMDYRHEHGMIRNIEELADNKHFTHEAIKKLTPYVETE